MNSPMTRSTARLEGVVPILSVRDLKRSVEYYVRALGFKVDWEHTGVMAGISRNGAGLMLCEGDQGHPGTWIWFGVSDADQLFSEFRASGAIIGMPPTNYAWAYELHVQDPDGHVLRFGSESKEHQPILPWKMWYAGT